MTTKDPTKLYVINSSEGKQCGVIRAVKISSHCLPTKEQLEQMLMEDITPQLAYIVQVCIMPIRFFEFWNLIWSRKVSTDQSNMYEFYKWKLAFDSYKEGIPVYYNDYFNSFFKFLQIP